MTTAVDTNILLHVLSPDSPRYPDSRDALRREGSAGSLIVGEVVVAELASEFANDDDVSEFLASLAISVERSTLRALYLGGTAFNQYLHNRRGFRCPECGSRVEVACPRCRTDVTRRQHILPDFMIGAHALVHAGRLLTRDRGYYATYFPELVLV